MSRDLNDTLIFAKVVELGSFTAASKTLGLPKTTVNPLFVSNDPGPLQGAMLCGGGLMFASDVGIKPFVESGQAVRVLGGWVGPEMDLNAVFTRGRVPSPKVRAFVDFLVERLRFHVNYMQQSCPNVCKAQAAEMLELPIVEAAPAPPAKVRKVAAVA